MIDWLHEALTGRNLLWGVVIFVVTFTSSLAVVTLLLLLLPIDYFVGDHPRPFLAARHPILRWTLIVGKNLLGIVLVIVGVILSLPGVPGQGILTILIGVMLLNFPGKRRFERWLVSWPPVWKSVNGIRQKFGKPALVLHRESQDLQNL